jgi:hypothetical protein
MQEVVQYSEWIIPVPLLIAIAWVRFNSPPTNRSGTTFALFSIGLTIYCLLIAVLWLLVIIAVSQGSIGFDKLSLALGSANPQAQGEFAQYTPLVAALMMVADRQYGTRSASRSRRSRARLTGWRWSWRKPPIFDRDPSGCATRWARSSGTRLRRRR